MFAMELHKDKGTFHARTRKEWRTWLEKNGQSQQSVWLIIYHKGSHTKSIYYDEAVEEAICFGWIDSIAHKRDQESKYQYFTQRKPGSNWSKANRERAGRMLEQGLMTAIGQKLIDWQRKPVPGKHWLMFKTLLFQQTYRNYLAETKVL